MKNQEQAQIKTPLIEWQICEDESQWQNAASSIPDTPPAIGTPRFWSRRHLLRWGTFFACFLLLIIVPIGLWLWNSAQAGLGEIQGELDDAVAADLWAASHLPATQEGQNQQSDVESALWQQSADIGETVSGVEIRTLGLDWAVVQVKIRTHNSTQIYRQTRIYRHADIGWHREEISASLWGKASQSESKHFVFNYYSLDHEAVTEAAAQIDEIYLSLYSSFFLATPDHQKIQVVVDPEWTPLARSAPPEQAAYLIIGSPAATLAPEQLPESTMMTQALVLALLDHLSKSSAATYDLPPHWQPLLDGLQLWLLWDQQLPLAEWRRPVVRWLFWQPIYEGSSEEISSEEFAHTLCALHSLWINSPLEIGIPVACLRQNGTDRINLTWRVSASKQADVSLPQLTFHDERQLRTQSTVSNDSAVNVVLLATVVEYITTEYGSNQVPILLAALPEHESWETLIPTFYNISAEEFESRWHEFLARRYGFEQ